MTSISSHRVWINEQFIPATLILENGKITEIHPGITRMVMAAATPPTEIRKQSESGNAIFRGKALLRFYPVLSPALKHESSRRCRQSAQSLKSRIRTALTFPASFCRVHIPPMNIPAPMIPI